MKTDWRPLVQVRKDLRVEWYRSPIDRARLRELSRRSDLQRMVSGWRASHALRSSRPADLPFLVAGCLAGLHRRIVRARYVGSFFYGAAPHELGHGTVFHTKWLNKLFMHLFGLLGWSDHFDYASSHTYHHRYTMYPDGDRENLPSFEASVWLQLLTLNLFSKPGRNFGKGGLISTIFVTIKSSVGIVGSTTIPSREWLQALHDDQPAEMRKSMWWATTLPCAAPSACAPRWRR